MVLGGVELLTLYLELEALPLYPSALQSAVSSKINKQYISFSKYTSKQQ